MSPPLFAQPSTPPMLSPEKEKLWKYYVKKKPWNKILLNEQHAEENRVHPSSSSSSSSSFPLKWKIALKLPLEYLLQTTTTRTTTTTGQETNMERNEKKTNCNKLPRDCIQAERKKCEQGKYLLKVVFSPTYPPPTPHLARAELLVSIIIFNCSWQKVCH